MFGLILSLILTGRLLKKLSGGSGNSAFVKKLRVLFISSYSFLKSLSVSIKFLTAFENENKSEDVSVYENNDTDIAGTDFADIFDIDESNEIEDTGEIEIEESELLNSGESDVNLQNEFRELSPSDQQEILNVLKETKI